MTAFDLIDAGLIGYLAAAAGYLVLALLTLRWWNHALSGLLLLAAALVTFGWASVTAYGLYTESAIGRVSQSLEFLRSGAWILLLLGLLYWMPPARRLALASVIIGVCICLAVATFFFGGLINRYGGDVAPLILAVTHLAIAIGGLALVENLFRNSPQPRYWTIKYLCLGAGSLFAYDFFLYSDALLFRRLSPDFLLARGATNFLLTPFLVVYAARNREEGPQITISRQLAFHTATLIGAGFYLMLMAGAGYYVREFGGSWNGFLEAVFLFGAILLLLVPITSGSVRAYVRVLIEKSLFKYRYEYRAEWLRFIRTISTTRGTDDLRARVIEAVCNIMESPEGALWLQREPGKFSLIQSWNASRWNLDSSRAVIVTNSPLADFLQRTEWIVNLEEYAATPEKFDGLTEIPEWLAQMSRAWLIVPLIHHDKLFGIMVLGRPRAERPLSWEDFDILKTVGRQAASYLAQRESDEALAEARQFEAFNKRFAFVAHDIKNLVSQLSLVLTNAARHHDRIDFQTDVIETLRQSVDKLNRMLRQLRVEPRQAQPMRPVDLAALLRSIVAGRRRADASLLLELGADTARVAGDEERLMTVVDHLVQNALDAVGEDGRVEVRLRNDGGMAAVEIEDNGPGMDPEFVRDRLFRPFDSTKGSGYGIGAYESREYARSLGGQLEVISKPGQGTIMRMSLPRVDPNIDLSEAADSGEQPAGTRQ